MSTLQHLDLSNNKFYGPIPARINDLWGLHYLDLSSNNFSGGFPTGIRNLQQLKTLNLQFNGLWGDIQDLFSELRNVEHVDLSCNMFFGSISMDIVNVSSLANTAQYLNLSHNRLEGEFFRDDALVLFRNLRVLDLGNNQLSGELPDFGVLPSLQVLRLGNNQLFGSVPEELLESFIPLQELDLSGNGFSGALHEINSTTLSTLNLSSNHLSGSIPFSLGQCLKVDLSNNIFTGDISIMQNWDASLEIVDLSSNGLTGSIPNLTAQFQKLAILNLHNNSLVGSLPTVLGTFQSLSAVDLSLNKLDGPIPSNFFTSMTLTNLNLSGNYFNGSIPFQRSHASGFLTQPIYPMIESLDLSDNSLTGTLPSDIGNLGRLKLLNLAKNDLSGSIPNELSKLDGLDYLDLSGNNFTGQIPDKLPSSLKVFNLTYNNLTGSIPEDLKKFYPSSFHPGNSLLDFPDGFPSQRGGPVGAPQDQNNKKSKSNIKLVIILASVIAAAMIAFVLFAYLRAQKHGFGPRTGFNAQTTNRNVTLRRFSGPSFFKPRRGDEPPATSLSFSNDHLLTANSRSLSGQAETNTEIVEHIIPDVPDHRPAISERKSSSDSPASSSPRFIDAIEHPVTLDVNSPDRLAGELFFLDPSLAFTAEELSRAPAEVLGRSNHGTLYKATLDSGHMLTVKWMRVGLVKQKKEFGKEIKKIGSMRHPNIVQLRAYYWGPQEQERLILADYIRGDSLALHLYETTPRRNSKLSFSQRLKVSVDVARCLTYLHEKGLPHGNLKPNNIILTAPELSARVTDYSLHRLMTPPGIAEQILNLGALGYRAPELSTTPKPSPSFKADVYAFGVILMELLTRRSAGDIISGQSGAVDLTDWVRLCDQEGRGLDCIDRDIADGEEHSRAMDEVLSVSLRCILPVNERPNMRQVLEDLSSVPV